MKKSNNSDGYVFSPYIPINTPSFRDAIFSDEFIRKIIIKERNNKINKILKNINGY